MRDEEEVLAECTKYRKGRNTGKIQVYITGFKC
jgi:hypothetical protein